MAMNCGKDNLAEETTGKNTDWPKWDKFSISFNYRGHLGVDACCYWVQ